MLFQYHDMRYINLAVVLTLSIAGGCGSSESEDPVYGPACESGKMTLEGEVDGIPVSGNHDGHNYAFFQGQTGSFTGSFGEDGDFDFTWKNLVATGDTTRIQGSITLPDAQGTYCIGGNSRMLVGSDFWRFELVGLAKGTCPGVATNGVIRACFNSSF